ncbi:hypothetical protein [Campylobacter sp.]|uniref:hypothetical protein n=1 Tax=Campylobacter sp. TaxID=205 RepID=UPI0026DCAD7F|nr:hypothetical protein [Campylobacter sp.]MDO4673963.1 hypothetical protein [Campylobacter sp.]
MNLINSTLPILIKVVAKSGLGHYTLLLNHKEMKTKSYVELELGAQYLAEPYMQAGMIHFKHLSRCPEISPFEEGLGLIVELLEGDLDFQAYIVENLAQCKDSATYRVLKEMLFASLEGVFHIPFVFEGRACLLQMKKRGGNLELYLYFSVFGALKMLSDEAGVRLFTPFLKVQKFLSTQLEIPILCEGKIEPLFAFKKLFDFKG